MQNGVETAAADAGRIGFIGLGRMGFALASNLARKGYPLTVFDIRETRGAQLAGDNVHCAKSAGDVAAACDIVFLMLPGPKEVTAVLQEADGVYARARANAVIVDMSTVDPATADGLAEAASALNLSFADAPVGRLAAHADKGESLFMVGASDDVFTKIRPLLEAMGTTIYHCGKAGSGTRTKLVNNFLVLSYCQLNSEALTLAMALGLDLSNTMNVLLETTASNGQLRDKWPVKVLRGDTTPGFDVVLGLKDLTLACRAAEQVGVTVALGGKARDIFQRAVDEGYSGQDTSVLTDFWAKANSLRPVRLPD
ncbi:NAD(P)-dependent oxidoreductase [Oricola nitratireducens]|uniref:NAD(P)-dependent oxidoreductase n=1 Tax=Oricola nitratireducens TaxID=2775868 RepID=UPI001867D756|nr:NAD(P)-dependent oxidoreductase [Oricola nitratireducens]